MARDGSSDDEKRAAGLRQLAERQVALTSAEVAAMPPDSLKALVYELQVHQVELDMQNEELRRVQFDLAEARDRYLDLFAFAPVAYLTLNANQVVENANLTAAAMFGIDRGKLLGQKMARFAVNQCRDDCHRNIQQVLDSSSKQVCELSFVCGDETLFVGRMEIVPLASPHRRVKGARVTVTDITAYKRAEEAMAAAKRRGRGRQLREKPLPGHDEPRTTHADDRHPRYGRIGAGRTLEPDRARIHRDAEGVGRQSAVAAERSAGFLPHRGRQAYVGGGAVRPAAGCGRSRRGPGDASLGRKD